MTEIVVGDARVVLGDCRDVLRTLADNSVDSVVTDPPYEIGFMGRSWDSTGVAYDVTVWAECLRVLKPGGHILAFGGSRTWHRLAVAVEDAGFEIRDSIAWIYGSGFPKSLDVSKAIDKKAGAEREVVGYDEKINVYSDRHAFGGSQVGKPYEKSPITSPSTAEAQQWSGWGTALKPAFEPVVVGRKPFGKGVTVAENVLAWGVGGLNIDASRIAGDMSEFISGTGKPRSGKGHLRSYGAEGDFGGDGANPPNAKGRWPANVILDEVTAGLVDEKSGVSKSPKPYIAKSEKINHVWSSGIGVAKGQWHKEHGDSGGASRFFYQAKASKRDRNEGLEGLETKPAGSLNMRTDAHSVANGMDTGSRQNFHPTVKPTPLMRYLIKLVTPPGGTVLDPFTGSGSTGKAALLDGFKFVGAELTEEYLPIIEGRLRWALEHADEETLF
jgi:DNA modification methylase